MGKEQTPMESRELVVGAPLGDALDFFDVLTRQRNEREFPSAADRGVHLGRAGRDIWTAVTRVKDEEKRLEILRVAAPRAALRIFTALQKLGTKEEFIDKFIENYTKCKRCGNPRCTCDPVERSTAEYRAERLQGQGEWSIAEWQRHLANMYGSANDARGVLLTIGQLQAEISEAAEEMLWMEQALRAGDGKKAEDHRHKAIDELSQCFAWLIGVCNLQELQDGQRPIDLEKQLVEIYGKGCPRCKNFQCTCGTLVGVEARKDAESLNIPTL